MRGLLSSPYDDETPIEDPIVEAGNAMASLEAAIDNLDRQFDDEQRLSTAHQALGAMKDEPSMEFDERITQWFDRLMKKNSVAMNVSTETFSDASNVASLESNVKDSLEKIWKSILQTIQRVYEWADSLWQRYRRATEQILMANRDLRIGLKRMGADMTDLSRDSGVRQLTEGSVRPYLHRLGYDQNGELEFGPKTISTLKSTGELFKEFSDQDLRDGEAFKAAIAQKDLEALKRFESKNMKAYGVADTEDKMLPNTKMIGAVALYATRGKLVVRPTVKQLKFVRRRPLELAIRRFARIPILMDLTMEIESAARQVRVYNETSGQRRKLAAGTQKEIRRLLDKPGEDLAERRRIAVAWSKVAFRRSDLVSLALIRSLDAGVRVLRAFVS